MQPSPVRENSYRIQLYNRLFALSTIFFTLEDFSYGGIAGWYHPVSGEYNSKGEALNVWDVSMDSFTDRSGNTSLQESMWPYVSDIQRDFAARAAADTFEKGEQLRFTAHAGSLS